MHRQLERKCEFEYTIIIPEYKTHLLNKIKKEVSELLAVIEATRNVDQSLRQTLKQMAHFTLVVMYIVKSHANSDIPDM